MSIDLETRDPNLMEMGPGDIRHDGEVVGIALAAEGFSRYFPRDFARFVRIAKGSLSEVIVHIGSARDKGLATEAEFKDICSHARRARGAATGLIRYLETAKRPDEEKQE